MVILYLHKCLANTAGAGVISCRSVIEWFMVLLRWLPKRNRQWLMKAWSLAEFQVGIPGLRNNTSRRKGWWTVPLNSRVPELESLSILSGIKGWRTGVGAGVASVRNMGDWFNGWWVWGITGGADQSRGLWWMKGWVRRVLDPLPRSGTGIERGWWSRLNRGVVTLIVKSYLRLCV